MKRGPWMAMRAWWHIKFHIDMPGDVRSYVIVTQVHRAAALLKTRKEKDEMIKDLIYNALYEEKYDLTPEACDELIKVAMLLADDHPEPLPVPPSYSAGGVSGGADASLNVMTAKNRPGGDHYKTDDELHEEAWALAARLTAMENDFKQWTAANPEGSAPGLVANIAAGKKRFEEITQLLKERDSTRRP